MGVRFESNYRTRNNLTYDVDVLNVGKDKRLMTYLERAESQKIVFFKVCKF